MVLVYFRALQVQMLDARSPPRASGLKHTCLFVSSQLQLHYSAVFCHLPSVCVQARYKFYVYKILFLFKQTSKRHVLKVCQSVYRTSFLNVSLEKHRSYFRLLSEKDFNIKDTSGNSFTGSEVKHLTFCFQIRFM